jgi:transposase-like protein
MARKKRTSEEMFPVVEAYLESGKTQKAFCLAENIPLAVFAYWLSKYRRSRDTSFVEIAPPRGEESALLEVLYPSGVRLRFFGWVDASYVGSLLEQ